MTEENSENKNLRNYLLGMIEESGREQIEERLMTDDIYFQELLIEEDELIREYIDDNLDENEKTRFETHFLITDERRKKLNFARALRRKVVEERLPEKKPPEKIKEPEKAKAAGFFARLFAAPFPVAAGFLVIFGLSAFFVWNFYLSRSADSDQGLVSLNKAFKNERPLNARISAFEYAPKTNTRGGGEEKIDTIELSRAGNLILTNASENPNAENLHALGRLYLAKKEFDKAITELEKSEKLDPQNAQTHNDLGVAYLEKSRVLSEDEGIKAELLGMALDRFRKAISLNPNLPEAYFNSAINLQLLNLKSQAKESWTQYLKLDPSSSWAEEARRNLSNLEAENSRNKTSEEIKRDFLSAFRTGDSDTAYRIVSANREMITGKLIPQQLAFLLLESNDGADRRENLEALKFIGELEAEKTGDPYFREIAVYYNSISKAQIINLTNAKNSVQKGYKFCLKSNYKDALAEFIAAREFYSKAGNTWEARLCDYWIAYCEFLTDDLRKSTQRLAALIDYCEKNNFKWLAAQAFHWLSINAKAMNEVSKSIRYAKDSLKFSEETNDLYNTQRSLSWLADSYLQINQYQKAFFHIQKTLKIGENPDSSIRQKGRDFDVAARLFFSAKMYETAAEFQKEMLELYIKEIEDLSYGRVGYANLANIYAAQGKFEEALEFADKGKQVAETLTDEKARGKAIAYSNLYIAELKRKNRDCPNASENYAQAIEIYDSMEFQAGKFLALKGRLLCGAADKNDALIQTELPKMLNLFEENRRKITEEQNRNAFFDGEQDIYDLAIEYEFSNGNFEKAFDYSEESRSRSLLDLMNNGVKLSEDDADIKVENVTKPLNLPEILQKLPTGVQIVQYAVLERKTIIWLIGENSVESISVEIAAADLNEKISAFLSAIKAENQERQQDLSRELYKILIEPIETDFNADREIYIIPDKKLFYLPFAALISDKTNKYLIADYKIAYSPSTNVFLTSTENADHKQTAANGEKLLSVGNPSFNRKEFADLADLPSASNEARAITAYYRLPTLLLEKQATKTALIKEISQADVIHFAGHYVVNEHSPLQSGFLVAPDETNSELENHALLKQNLKKPRLIVLSACDTALEGFYKGEGTLGAGRTFLAAGIPLVVASQWQVDSDATAELMKKFHFYRKTGNLSTVSALHKAQLEMLENPDFNQPYFWAGFLTLGGYARY